MQLDPRSVANVVIDYSRRISRPISPLSLQKILYFINGRYLIAKNSPLMQGYFEAWKYGPVHPTVYEAFKSFGSGTIDGAAKRLDLRTGAQIPVDKPTDPDLCGLIEELAHPYLQLSAGRLVDVSHARGSPWDAVTLQADGSRVFGLRITEEITLRLFNRHKVSVTESPRVGEPNEESPPN